MRDEIKRIVMPLLLSGTLMAAGSCTSLTSPNFNFADLDDLLQNPTRAKLINAAQGLLIGNRVYVGAAVNDLNGQLGILGRESYNLDNQDPRFESTMLRPPNLDPAAPAFGGNFWSEPYANARMGDIVLRGLEACDPACPTDGSNFTAAEQEWIRGFVKTVNAIDFLTVVTTRDDECGCPITFEDDPNTPAPTVGKAAVYDHIETLLDEAKTHLQSASGAPPFQLSTGFAGFDTAAGFLEFNRAIRARVAVHLADWTTALQALDESFLDETAPMDLGVYHVFTNNSGDITNGYLEPGTSPNFRAHPSIRDDAELQADGVTPDDRYVRKTRPIENRSFQGLCSDQAATGPTCTVGIALYQSINAPIPMVRNEELILLRAEANIGLGNLGPAESDINLVRDVSGKLPAVTLADAEQALDQLLYEKRYSLFMEAQRWIDMRRYGRLDELPLDLAGHVVHERFPIPIDEQLARGQGGS